MDHPQQPDRFSAFGFCHTFGLCNSSLVIPLRVLGEMRIAQDTAAGRRQFELIMEQRRLQKTRAGLERIAPGLVLGR